METAHDDPRRHQQARRRGWTSTSSQPTGRWLRRSSGTTQTGQCRSSHSRLPCRYGSSSTTRSSPTRSSRYCTRSIATATASTRSSITRRTTGSSRPRSVMAHTPPPGQSRGRARTWRAATFMLFAQVELGHACPISMTHSAVRGAGRLVRPGRKWMPRPVQPSLRRHARRRQDLGAVRHGHDRETGWLGCAGKHHPCRIGGRRRLRLIGHKWFCSAPMSDAFLVLAQASGGLAFSGAARARGRRAQRVPHSAAQRQARQPVQRL